MLTLYIRLVIVTASSQERSGTSRLLAAQSRTVTSGNRMSYSNKLLLLLLLLPPKPRATNHTHGSIMLTPVQLLIRERAAG